MIMKGRTPPAEMVGAKWLTITKPEWSQRYGYGGRVEYDLVPGGAYRALASDAMRSMGAPEVAIEGAGGGWSWVLSDLKTLLETGESFTSER